MPGGPREIFDPAPSFTGGAGPWHKGSATEISVDDGLDACVAMASDVAVTVVPVVTSVVVVSLLVCVVVATTSRVTVTVAVTGARGLMDRNEEQ